MQSEKNTSSTPTSVLFLPKLPPLLANWNTLKTHFSQYGNVRSVVLNPQDRSATVSFETTADAEYAKSKGCVWKNKEFRATYCSGTLFLDPRAKKSNEVFGYSELEALWDDDDIEQFGVVNTKSPRQQVVESKSKRTRKDEGSASKEIVEKTKLREIKIPKVKLSSEKKSPKSPKLKSSSEKKSPTLKPTSERKTRLMTLYSVKEKQKEAKKKVKEALLELSKKKRLSASKLTKEADVVMKTSDTPALSLKEKFNVLEERDKLIRKSLVKSSDVKTAKAIIGTCPDMCPEKERIMREYRRLVSFYEMIPGTQKMDHTIAVKAYVRSSADQEEPLPHELRPEPVLSMTMGYLITKIMPLIDDPDVNVSEWYDFCWDRLRGIRKDVIQQQLCSLKTVTILEQCARFHICCYDYFWGADPSIFDEKINTENLMNCLQTLRHMYEDLSKEDIRCPNEAEFNAYMILLNMKTGDLMATYQLFSESLQKEERIQTAVKLYLAFNNVMYSQFFKLVKNNSTYLDACLLQRYFYQIRVQALQAIARAYCPPNKSGTIPLKQMKTILKFDNAEDTELFCEGHGLMLKENRRDFSLYRNDFFLPDTKIKSFQSSSLVTNKRLPLVEAVTGGRQYYLRSFENHKIHSSFSDGKLNEMASDASDQKNKSSEMHSKSIDSERFEDLTDPDDEEMTEMKAATYFTFDEPVSDTIDGEEKPKIKEKETLPMDIDDENNVQRDKEAPSKISYSETDFNKIDDVSDNNEAVSRKHSESTAFKFELTSAKMKPTEESAEQQPVTFSFGSAAANIFGTKNQLISSQLKQNQFSLKIDFTEQSSKNDMAPTRQGGDSLNTSKSTDTFKPSVGNTEALNQSFSFSINKTTENKVTTVGSNQFTFDLGTKKQLSSSEIDKHISVNLESSKSVKDTSMNNADLNRSKSLTDSFLEAKHNYEFNKENESPSDNLKVISSPTRKFSSDNYVDIKGKEKMYNKKEKDDLDDKKLNEIKRKLQEKEREVFNQLKKDLRRRLKTVSARHFIRKWKQKVKRLKQNREDFPLLISTPVEDHETVWGTALGVRLLSTQTLLNRLKVKQQNIESVDLILNKGLHNTVSYVGKEIAENVVLNNSLKLELRDFNIPYYWKLIVSVPFSERSFFTKKFSGWLNKVFYGSDNLRLGSVIKETTSQDLPVYYCVHLVTGNDFHDQKDTLNGMNGLIFFNINGIENSIEKCKRFRNLISSNKSTKPVTVALLNIGKNTNDSNAQLIGIMNDKVKVCKLKRWVEEYWSDFNSITRIVKFLTLNIDLSNDIRVRTIYSLFSCISEHLVNVIDSAKITSDEFNSAMLNPNFLIDFYNLFFSELEKITTDSNLRYYDIVPPEFKDLVCYLNKPGKDLPFDVSFNKSRRPNILKAFSRLELPHIKPWPPHDTIELLDTFDAFCDAIGCRNILPRLIRAINLDDDIDVLENLNRVSWVNIVDLIVRWMLETYSDDNNKIVVIYKEDALSRLCQIDFSFKLLYSNLKNY